MIRVIFHAIPAFSCSNLYISTFSLFRHGSNELDSASSTRKVQPCHPSLRSGSCMDYQHRNPESVSTSYLKEVAFHARFLRLLGVRCSDLDPVTMWVTHTRSRCRPR